MCEHDRWYCATCVKGFYEPKGFDSVSNDPHLRLSCPWCFGYKTKKVEKFMSTMEQNPVVLNWEVYKQAYNDLKKVFKKLKQEA